MITYFKGYIHLTQLVQAEALMFGYRGWRKQWGQNRKCGGALVWQLNDCWPVTSWSIVDYYQRKKPAYYSMRRVLAPIAIAVRRDHWDWSVAHARSPATLQWECWAVSKEPEATDCVVELRFISISTGSDIREAVTKAVQIAPNGTTPVLSGIIDVGSEEPHVVAATLRIGNVIVSRDCDWPQPFKYLDFRDRGVRVEWDGEDTLQISANRPTKGLVFEERIDITLDDSAIDVVPGDTQIVRVRGLKPEDPPLRWRYLGME
jgi:beta-mannosidase